ncbi:MAG: bile acid:sodium symporter family protein [Mesorhizobium sp.]|nr:bile acid:sodium symporter family protein [Mesorhizobium sp.]
MLPLDEVALNFNPASLAILNAILAVVMFGVALDLTIVDFTRLLHAKRAFFVGFLAQFIYMPAATYLLILILQPQPSIALGMILVAACPGGNISNFVAARANGNVALSVSLSAMTTLIAIVMTPVNITFYGRLYEPAAGLLRDIAVDPWQMAMAVAVMLAVPLALGMLVRARAPALAARLRRPMQIVSLAVFALFIAAALAANWHYFVSYVGAVFFVVLLHNAVGLAGGYGLAWAARLDEPDRRSIAIEAGMQNTGFGLVLIFNFFNGLGGMAIIAAWWGVWHLVSGIAVAAWFRGRDRSPAPSLA